ncbi:GAF domain-containing protein [Falsirhodobacter xinxiangensis]|uniref:GAF domain-containing protein n=1 Tax=Falsirhodobacter xinxiangensis TaxID=2530049 RepID=UPI00145B796B|nr:GAF domain-containing protein [Rhodobacter xinxiangensis]
MSDLEKDNGRLAVLSSFDILDTEAERGFDDIVLLATQICSVPVALVSLVDRDRQWFIARRGFEPCQTDLNSSVCKHALGLTDILEITDLTADPRTAMNPLVVHAPHIRFYAGAPLTARDGHSLGTLCVIDHIPRPEGLTPAQRTGLLALANQVMAQLELRQAGAALRAEQQRVEAEAIRFEALIDAQHAIAAPGADLHVAFQAIVKTALSIVDAADGAAVELISEDELSFDTAAGSLASHVGYRLPLATSLSGRSVLDNRTILSNDITSDAAGDHDLAKKLGIRSLIAEPISRQGVMIGALKVSSGRANSFTARDVVMTQMLAGLVASAVGGVKARHGPIRPCGQSKGGIDRPFRASRNSA